MNKPLEGDEDGLIACYQFDELEGDTLPDLSSNDLDGTLINMTESNWTAGANAAFTRFGPKGQAEPGAVAVEGGEIESIEYIANGSSLRATVYGKLGRKVQVEVNSFRDSGNNEMQEMQSTVPIKLDGPAEASLVTIETDDRVLHQNHRWYTTGLKKCKRLMEKY